jgi:hypothetical protein
MRQLNFTASLAGLGPLGHGVPYFKLVLSEQRNGGPRLVLGEVALEPGDAAVVKAVAELISGIAAERLTVVWEGVNPPALEPPLPTEKILRLAKTFGVIRR